MDVVTNRGGCDSGSQPVLSLFTLRPNLLPNCYTIDQQQPQAHHQMCVPSHRASQSFSWASSSTLAARCAGLLTARWVASLILQTPRPPHSQPLPQWDRSISYNKSLLPRLAVLHFPDRTRTNTLIFPDGTRTVRRESSAWGKFRGQYGGNPIELVCRSYCRTQGNRCYIWIGSLPSVPHSPHPATLSDPSIFADTSSSFLGFPSS